MHYHVPKPFYRKSRNTWYVELNGRQVNLGKDRDEAFSGIMKSWPRRPAIERLGPILQVTEFG